MRVPLKQQIKYNLSQQTLTYNEFEPFLHVDNPTNARIVFDNGQVVGPYTLNAVVSTPGSSGSFQADTSDTTYPNVNIFTSGLITAWLTNEEPASPGISYAPVANINSTITVSGNVNATVTNTINATITNASIPVTQSGTWNVNITNATISVAQSGAWNVTVSGTVNIGNTPSVTISGTPTVNIGNTPSVTITGTAIVNITGTTGVTQTGTISGDFGNNGYLNTAGLQSFHVKVNTSTLLGTMILYYSNDNGVTSQQGGQFTDTSGNVLGTSIVNPVAGATYGILPPAGATNILIVVHPYTSGSINVTASGSTVAGPSVLITGNPTVILGGGTASIGSVSAINSTVTVAGTINIGNTPAVTISGTPSVTISSGTVSISGTPNINIQSQSVNLNVQAPQTSLGNFSVGINGSNNATYNVPTGTHAIGILVTANGLGSLAVQGVTSGVNYINLSFSTTAQSGYFISPILSVLDTQVKVTGVGYVGQPGATTVYSVAILDAEGVFVFDNVTEPASVSLYDLNSGHIIDGNHPLAVQLTGNDGLGRQQGTWTPTQVTLASLTTAQLVASNVNRRGLIILPVSGAINILIHGATPVIVQVPALGYWEMPSPISTAQIDGGNLIAANNVIDIHEIT